MAIDDRIASVFNGSNVAYLADLYTQWVEDHQSVDSSFADIFAQMDDAQTVILQDARGASWAPRPLTDIHIEVEEKPVSQKTGQVSKEQLLSVASDSLRATQLVNAYRAFGNRHARVDPLNLHPQPYCRELDIKTYGFTEKDLDRPIYLGRVVETLLNGETHKLRDIITALQRVYCRTIAWEYMYLQDAEPRQWLRHRIEKLYQQSVPADDKKRILQQLAEGVGLENFCQKRYVGVKRFGLDGGEVVIPALHALIRHSVGYNTKSIAVGMAHRGRLNVLTNIIGKPFIALFHEFAGKSYKSDDIPGVSDVKYHLGYYNKVTVNGKEVNLSLAFNPSHLEPVGAVVEGQIRAAQDRDQQKHLPVIIHGDAAFAGQGIVYEVFTMSQLPAYKTGGSIHIVINNQIGFTTTSDQGYSGYYCTDVAKVARAPIIHVNGDDPEAVVQVMQLAVDFREEFSTDVVVDIVCYRRYGHNETDEPIFTQPLMYEVIRQHRNVFEIYAEQLAKENIVSKEVSQKIWDDFQQYLQDQYAQTPNYLPNDTSWRGQEQESLALRGQNRQDLTTCVPLKTLQEIGRAISSVKEGFNCHSKLIKQLEIKAAMFETGEGLDWATGEALAFGSLLLDGHPVRLTGQDCQRGTFSHRNATLFDQKTQQSYFPLNHIQEKQAQIEVYNSFLSEFAVLGFEYGYSFTNTNALVLWEAQFGDFVNTAQVILDQFISAGESKWLQMSGLVMLLPHAQEGQGAEHSSARLERFLQLCAEDNMQVCNVSTPANYFHVLRRQMKRNYRQPLVIMSPKSLLRHKLAQSSLSEFAENTEFLAVIDDVGTDLVSRDQVKRVVICSGKVYYDLWTRRQELDCRDIALVRLEQFYPFPSDMFGKILKTYPKAEIVWCQEEPENMGGWNFVDRRLEQVLHSVNHQSTRVRYAGRHAMASPATGLMSVYKAEQDSLVNDALCYEKV